MTLILGARCTDGVVLVADRLVVLGDSPTYAFDKIRRGGNIPWAVFGAAGVGTLFEEFLTLLPQNVTRHQTWMTYQNAKLEHDRQETFGDNTKAPHPPIFAYTVEDFKHDCVELLIDMKKRYAVAFENDRNWCELQILIGLNVGTEAKLYYLESENCMPAEVPLSLFIGQGEICEVFRKCWNSSMTMEQSAKLGAFTIKYVKLDKISETIGVGSSKPQLWYIPDGNNPREVVGTELDTLMQDVDHIVQVVYSKLHSLFRS
jgi:hypothetical protein